MALNKEDLKFLKLTLRLAEKGRGFVNPNPMVGAVLVKNGKIIGKGYHKKYGSPHAEVEAFKDAKESTNGATLYVSLEPCSHLWKNTPPCVPAVISSGVTRVVCCTKDPNPKVFGQGIEQLESAGIKVEFGGLEKEAETLNEAFFYFQRHQRPFVAIKFACSLDGRIATYSHDSKWITNEKARDYAREIRGQFQAIMVGTNTILKDNPNLGAKKGQRDPLRVILDRELKIKLSTQVYRDNNVIVFTSKAGKKIEQLRSKGIEVILLNKKDISIARVIKELVKRKIISLFVEGGAGIHGSFVDSRLADKFYVFFSPVIIGGEKSLSAIGGKGVEKVRDALRLKNISIKYFEDNWMIKGETAEKSI